MKKLVVVGVISALLVGCGQEATETVAQSKDAQLEAQEFDGWVVQADNHHLVSIQNTGANQLELVLSKYVTKTYPPEVVQIPGEKPERIPGGTVTYRKLESRTFSRNGRLNVTSQYLRDVSDTGSYTKFGSDFYKTSSSLFFNNKNLGGKIVGSPAIASHSSGHLDVFVWGADNNQLWTKSSLNNGNTWSDHWKPLGGILTSEPTVVSGGPNHLDVFTRGTDNQLWHRWWNGATWSNWESLGGIMKSAPSAAVRGNKIDVVAYGIEGDLWRQTWTGSRWTGWIKLGAGPAGGSTTSKPYIGHTSYNHLEVFAYANGAVAHKTFTVD